MLAPSLFFYWPTQRVGLSSFFFLYWPTQRVGLSSFFLLANSTCWPVIIFFTGQFNVLACHDFFYRPTQRVGLSWLQPDGSHRLLLLAFPHAREILLEVLTIDSNRKLDAIQFLEHVCIPRQNLINLARPVPSWRPLAILFIFSS